MYANKIKLKDNEKAGLHQLNFLFRHWTSPGPLVGTLLVVVLILSGCSSTRSTHRQPPDNSSTSQGAVKDVYLEKISALRDDLAHLNRQANVLEAEQVAETAVTYASDLAEEYNLVRPAILHNVFVRIGLKDRGLCYHWAEDLMQRGWLIAAVSCGSTTASLSRPEANPSKWEWYWTPGGIQAICIGL
jgi:hypothetical protein